MDQVADLSYYEPDEFRIDVDRLPDAAKAAMAGNRAALPTYGGPQMADPGLLGRLAGDRRPGAGGLGRGRPHDPARARPGLRRGHPRRPAPASSRRPGTCPSSRHPASCCQAPAGLRGGPASPDAEGSHRWPRYRSWVRTTAKSALSGPIQMRILEDGQTTEHRLGIGEITIAPHTDRAAAAPARPARRGLLRGRRARCGSRSARTSYDAPAGTPGDGAARRPAHVRQPR